MAALMKPYELSRSLQGSFKAQRAADINFGLDEPAWTVDPGGHSLSDFRKRQSFVRPSSSAKTFSQQQPSYSAQKPVVIMSKRRSPTPNGGSARNSISRTNAIKLKPLSTVEESDLCLHPTVHDHFIDWCHEWTLLFQSTSVTQPGAGEKPNALFNRYNEMLSLDKRAPSDRIRWRFYTMFFYDLHVLLNEHDNLTARGFETLFTALDLENTSAEKADEVKRNLRSWIARGHRYRNLSNALGGCGILFLLPDKITEYLWEESLPLKGDAFEQAVQLLAAFGITQKANDLGANELGGKIEQGLLDPFRWNTQMSTAGSTVGSQSRMSISRSSSRSRSSVGGSIGGSNIVFSASPNPSSTSTPQQRQQLQRNSSQPIIPSQTQSSTQQSRGWGSSAFLETLGDTSSTSSAGGFGISHQAGAFQALSRSNSQLSQHAQSKRRLTPGEMTPFMSSTRAATPTHQQTYQPLQAPRPQGQLYNYTPPFVQQTRQQQHPDPNSFSMPGMDIDFGVSSAPGMYQPLSLHDGMSLDLPGDMYQASAGTDEFQLSTAHGAAGLFDESSYNFNVTEQGYGEQQQEQGQPQHQHGSGQSQFSQQPNWRTQ